jgi:hypothetical protein
MAMAEPKRSRFSLGGRFVPASAQVWLHKFFGRGSASPLAKDPIQQ